MSPPVLYHASPSRSITALWMLEEIGQPFELKVLNLQAGEQRDPDFLALNPMGKVPCLVDGETVVTETAAVCLHLAERFPEAGLNVPVGDPARGTMLRWMFFVPTCLEAAIMDSAMPRKEPAPKTMIGYGSLERTLAAIEGAIRPGPYLLGERLCVADILLGSTLGWAMSQGLLEKRPAFEAYAGRLAARPAFARTMARDQAIDRKSVV